MAPLPFVASLSSANARFNMRIWSSLASWPLEHLGPKGRPFSTSVHWSANKSVECPDRRNSSLERCGKAVSLHVCQYQNNGRVGLVERKPLALLLAWLGAKDKHLSKFREIWLQRGFDVLTLRLSRSQIIWPTLGVRKVIPNLVEFLKSSNDRYPDIVIHAFSVSLYTYGEILSQLEKEKLSVSPKVVGELNNASIENRIKGIVFDSVGDLTHAALGTATSISTNPLVSKTLEMVFAGYLKLAHPFATKYYLQALEVAQNKCIYAPSLLITSDTDVIGPQEVSLKLKNFWEESGINVDYKCFRNSDHIRHFVNYPKEYTKLIDTLLTKVKLESRTQTDRS